DDLSLSVLQSFACEGLPVKFMTKANNKCTIVLSSHETETAKKLILNHSGQNSLEENHDLGLLSVIGVGINFGTDVTSKITNVLAHLHILADFFHFSESRLSFGIPKAKIKLVANEMHQALFQHLPRGVNLGPQIHSLDSLVNKAGGQDMGKAVP
ncbi:MAG: hypothetical protein ACE5IR_24260, partial [bacterium]